MSDEGRSMRGSPDDRTQSSSPTGQRFQRDTAPTLRVPATTRASGPEPGWRRAASLVGNRARAAFGRVAGLVRRHPVRALLLTALLLLAVLVPSVLAYSSAYSDYSALKALGDDGLAHLLAAKDEFTGLSAFARGFAGASGGGASSGATSTSATGAAETFYTLLVQRQAGTYYPTQISITPGPRLKALGAKPQKYTLTPQTNTPLPYGTGLQATATPTATPTPSPTATPTKGSTKGSNGTPSGGGTSLIPDPAQVQAAQADLRIAENDFTQLRTRLDHLGWALGGVENLPGMGIRFSSLRALASVGVDAAQLGLLATAATLPLLTRLHGANLGSALSGGSGLVTQDDINRLETAIANATPILRDLTTQLDSVQVDTLPLNAKQQAEILAVQQALPQVQPLLAQAHDDIAAVGWMLGTDKTRSFLVQTLDRSELRADGGFSGDYGILNIRNGKIAPFTLTTVERTDYSYGRWYDGWVAGQRPPSAYSWWPIANWGLRDANLSADFPTNAKMTLNVFANECGAACQAAGVSPHLDGVIAITPIAIEHLLAITGPLYVPGYNETVTAANFEQKIHYYQLDPAGLAKQLQLSPNDSDTSARKAFTGLVGSLLEDRLKSLPQSELAPVIRQMLSDVRAKDIQIYVANPTMERLLHQEHLDGVIDTTPGEDGFLVVQENTSAAKATPCVTVTQRDNITLDDKGGATNTLTIAMNHVLGSCDPYPAEFTTYHAYMRIYVPPNAKLLAADGFDTNVPMCAVGSCPANPYPGGEMVCQPGGYVPTQMTYTLPGMGMGDPPGILDKLGAPTQTTSDVAGRAMWGGWVAIPPFCTQTLTLKYYVPGVVTYGGQTAVQATATAQAAATATATAGAKKK